MILADETGVWIVYNDTCVKYSIEETYLKIKALEDDLIVLRAYLEELKKRTQEVKVYEPRD